MDDWKEPSDYANIHVSGGKKKRDAITPHLRKAGLYRDKHTGKVMHQVKDRLIEAEDHSSTLSGNDNWEPSAALAEGFPIGNPTKQTSLKPLPLAKASKCR